MNVSKKPKKLNLILLIEDDDLTSSLYHMLIEQLIICNQIVIKSDGEEALEFIIDQQQKNKAPDLIFIDLKMMGLSGFEVLEEINKAKRKLSIPSKLVILTSSSFHKDIERAKELGIDDYIIKPLTEEKLISVLSKHF